MIPNYMRKFLLFSLILCLGVLVGGFSVNYFYSQLFNYSVQMDSAADAKIYIGVLKQIKSGNGDKAGELLEIFLSGTELVLNSCDLNDCEKSHQALQLIKEYKKEFDGGP